MKQLDLFKKEKDTLYRVQLAIANAPVMTRDILRDLTRNLGYPAATENYRIHVINDYIGFWWDYVGQWAWDQEDIRGTEHDDAVNKILKELNDGNNAEYPDEDLIFTKNLTAEEQNSDITYWAEVKHNTGKNSLWPHIIQLNEFGNILSAVDENECSSDYSRVVFAFKREVK